MVFQSCSPFCTPLLPWGGGGCTRQRAEGWACALAPAPKKPILVPYCVDLHAPSPSLMARHPPLPHIHCATCVSGESQREGGLCLAIHMDLQDSFHASMHTASQPPASLASPGASVQTKECVLSFEFLALRPWGTKSIPAGNRGPIEVQRRQRPHRRSPILSLLAAPETHFLCPFPLRNLLGGSGEGLGSPCASSAAWL